jgi:ethanolamine permease
MPKNRIAAWPGDTTPWIGLAGWQATGLSLAVASWAMFAGLGALLGAMLLAPVILALVRLRDHAPTARSTAGLVGSTLGGRVAAFTGALQIVAYTLLAVNAARTVGLQLTLWSDNDPGVLDSGLWPLFSVALAAAAGLATHLLPDRVIGGIVAVLAAVGMLITLFVSLAVLARVYAGTTPIRLPADPPRTGLDTSSALILLALVLVGFELITTHNKQIRSAGRPMGLAVAATTLLAAVIWLADHFGGAGGFRLGVDQFPLIVDYFYATAGDLWLVVAIVATGSAGLLALTWAVVGAASRLAERVPVPAITTASVVVTALLVVAFWQWSGLADKFSKVAALLLVVVYVLAVEAYTRIANDSTVAWWLRLLMPAVLAAAVLLPLLDTDFAATALWPVLVAAALAALCFAAAVATARRGRN